MKIGDLVSPKKSELILWNGTPGIYLLIEFLDSGNSVGKFMNSKLGFVTLPLTLFEVIQ